VSSYFLKQREPNTDAVHVQRTLILLSSSNGIGELGLLDDWRRLHDLLAHDVALDEVREPRVQLVADVALRWDGEDLCEREYTLV